MSATKKQKVAATAIEYHEPKVMAEIGCTHRGEVDISK